MRDRCPLEDAAVRAAWQEHGAAQVELRGIVEEGATIMADAIAQDVQERGDVAGDLAAGHPLTPVLPYGKPYTMLPPSALGPIEQSRPFCVPQNGPGREAALSRHLIEADSIKTLIENPPEGSTLELYSHANAVMSEYMLNGMQQVTKEGVEVDQNDWRLYQEAAAYQKEQGWYFMEAVTAFRAMSVAVLPERPSFMEIASGHFDYYKATLLNPFHDHRTPADVIALPIGAYGKSFTENLIRTTLYTELTAERNLPEWAEQTAERHPTALEHMARFRSSGSGKVGIVQSMQEGVLSIAQTISLITAEKVPGFETGEELMEAVVNQGLIEKFTKSVPMGFIGPIINEGAYIPNFVQTDGEKLWLDPHAIERLNLLRREQVKHIMGLWATYAATPPDEKPNIPSSLGVICPAAMPHGAIEKIVRSMCGVQSKIQPKDEYLLPIDGYRMYNFPRIY